MKWLFLLVALFSYELQALELGNPVSPEIPGEGLYAFKELNFDLKLGYAGDLTTDRKLELKHSSPYSQIDQFTLTSQAGTLALNFFKRCEFYGKLGSIKIASRQVPQEGTLFEYETHTSLFWEAGAKAVLMYWGGGRIGIDAKWMQTRADLYGFTINQAPIPVNNSQMFYREWQAGLGVSYPIERLIPYLGVTYSSSFARIKDLDESLAFLFPNRHFTVKERMPVGLALGCSFSAQHAFEMNVEVRLISEFAASLSGSIQF